MESVVLVVDDDPTARYGMRRALERQGYTLLEAESIASAELQVEKRLPDVILLDVKLASESGLEYLPSLVARKNPPIVIVVTAHGSERMAVEAIKLGATIISQNRSTSMSCESWSETRSKPAG